jgi:hypothetical protein
MSAEPVCEGCGEVVHVAVLVHHPDDGTAVLCERCAATWDEPPSLTG